MQTTKYLTEEKTAGKNLLKPILPFDKKPYPHLVKNRRFLNNLKNTMGISLVEVLVASLVMVILTGSIITFLLITNRSWTESENRLQLYQNARDALDFMSREIAGAFQPQPPSTPLPLNMRLSLIDDNYIDPYAVTRSSDTLMLTAAINVNPGPGESDLSHLGYRLDTTTNPDEPVLLRYKRDCTAGYDGTTLDGTWERIAVHIICFNIECFDHELGVPDWVDEWNDTIPQDYLPRAVRITITVQDAGRKFKSRSFQNIIYLPTS